jgi:hypothetical protein
MYPTFPIGLAWQVVCLRYSLISQSCGNVNKYQYLLDNWNRRERDLIVPNWPVKRAEFLYIIEKDSSRLSLIE